MVEKTDREKLIEAVRWILWKANQVKSKPKFQTFALFDIIDACVMVLDDIGEPLKDQEEA